MRLKIFAIAIALCVFLTACSGGGDENDTSADGQASDASSLTAAEDGNNVISDGNPSATNGESVTENGGHFSSSNKISVLQIKLILLNLPGQTVQKT